MCGRGVGGKGRVCLLAICQYCKSKGDHRCKDGRNEVGLIVSMVSHAKK
jgi:hypothetical protein